MPVMRHDFVDVLHLIRARDDHAVLGDTDVPIGSIGIQQFVDNGVVGGHHDFG
jgi:hypothetical protein